MKRYRPLGWLLLSAVFLLLGGQELLAQVRSSSNYQLQSDSINIGGGFSSSTNYVQESTVGEVATGESDSGGYSLKAGYQQMQEVFISMTTPPNVVMSPNLVGVGGGTSNGSTTVTVITDSSAGYELTIAAENDPSMQSGANTIADYIPATADPDYTFTTGNNDAHFAYSPSGVDVVQRFLDDGISDCNTSSTNTDLACWDGLSTTAETIASSPNSNHPAGATTTVNFRVGLGAGVVQVPGEYVATTTLTALPL